MKVRILEALHANRDGSCETFERGEVADLPQGTAKCLIRSRKALPIEETDVTFAADVERKQLSSMLDRYNLSVKLVADHEGLRDLHNEYTDLVQSLEAALEEVQATRELLETLRKERKDAAAPDTPEPTDAPSRSTIQTVEEELTKTEENVEALQRAMHTASDHFTSALDDAHRRAEREAQRAHLQLIEKALSAARDFQDVLSDLIRYEEGFSDRIGTRVGGLPELDRWIRDAEFQT